MTVGEALASLTARFAAAGIDTAKLDARVLIGHVLGIEPIQVFSRPERVLGADEAASLEAAALRRERREPMAHITGRREFWSLTFEVTADTLDPRADSETVVEAVLETVADRTRPLRLLDFGTGTGCLLLSLLSELPNATGLGIDRSEAALEVARRNAQSLGMAQRTEFRRGDWGRGLDGLFDVIVSNPPYIPDEDVAGLAPEVAAFEPRGALAGGPDGLDCYRTLIPDAARLLRPGGLLALEVGLGQAAPVGELVLQQGLRFQGARRDLAGIERCVLGTR
jgi:release factor glutamine methyltransferase